MYSIDGKTGHDDDPPSEKTSYIKTDISDSDAHEIALPIGEGPWHIQAVVYSRSALCKILNTSKHKVV